jgi:proline dehydrogenase
VRDAAEAARAVDGYLELARRLAEAPPTASVALDLSLATHDAPLRDGLLAELGPMDVEMLLGVRPEDHAPLLARGVTPRLYVPYGRDWFRYWMRRVAESQGAG